MDEKVLTDKELKEVSGGGMLMHAEVGDWVKSSVFKFTADEMNEYAYQVTAVDGHRITVQMYIYNRSTKRKSLSETCTVNIFLCEPDQRPWWF